MKLDLLRKQPQWVIIAEALLMVVILGVADYVTGYDVSLFVFYALPILFVVWFSGRAAAWGVCVASSVIWAIADVLSGHPYSDMHVLVWNTAVQLGFFLLAMVGGSAVKFQFERNRARVAELERFHILAQISPVGIFRTRASGACIYVNDRWCNIAGLNQDQALQKRWTDALHPDDKERVEEGCARALQQNRPFEFESRFLRADGSITWAHGCVASEQDTEAEGCGFVGAIMDMSEHRRLECEILEIGDREQQRIGQDLHDDLCQFLAAVQYTAASLRGDLQSKSLAEADTAREISDLLKEAVLRTRNLARGIFPVKLDPGGLVSALEELSANARRAFNIACSFKCDRPVIINERSSAAHLYRIAQESLHNAIRHGKAKRVAISLSASNGWITLTVEDDGVGIPEVLPENYNGMGLRIMEYRSHMMGGSIKIERNNNGGTTVSCSFRKANSLLPRETVVL